MERGEETQRRPRGAGAAWPQPGDGCHAPPSVSPLGRLDGSLPVFSSEPSQSSAGARERLWVTARVNGHPQASPRQLDPGIFQEYQQALPSPPQSHPQLPWDGGEVEKGQVVENTSVTSSLWTRWGLSPLGNLRTQQGHRCEPGGHVLLQEGFLEEGVLK